MSFSSTVLSLLIALLSVVGLVAPRLAEVLRNENSQLAILGTELRGHELHVSIVNTGTASGYLDEITVQASGHFFAKFDVEPTVIKPGGISFQKLNLGTTKAQNLGRLEKCRISARFLSSELVEKLLSRSFRCSGT